MSVEENKALVERWNEEIWNKGNVAAADELLTADFVFNYPFPGLEPNLEGYKQTVGGFHAVFQNMKITVNDTIAEGDKVVLRWSGQSTHAGEFMGIPPTGKEVVTTGITICRVEGGKIAEEWTEMDMLSMMQQLGAS